MKIIGNLGDRNPFDHGGFLVVQTEWGPQAVVWDSPDDEDEETQVYSFTIEDDVRKDLSWMKDGDWKAVARTMGYNGGSNGEHYKEYWRQGEDSDVLARASVYQDVGSYYGYDNLDGYPSSMTTKALSKKYSKALNAYYKRTD